MTSGWVSDCVVVQPVNVHPGETEDAVPIAVREEDETTGSKLLRRRRRAGNSRQGAVRTARRSSRLVSIVRRSFHK